MSRKPIPPRKVEALAVECRRLLDWLRGPGSGAEEDAFGTVLQAYRSLIDAVVMLPRGLNLLKAHKALPPRRRVVLPDTERRAATFLIDELVLLEKPVLTPDGWLVPAPMRPHLDDELAKLGAGGTVKQALRNIITRAAIAQGKSATAAIARDLRKWEARVSRERITNAWRKVPPGDGSV